MKTPPIVSPEAWKAARLMRPGCELFYGIP